MRISLIILFSISFSVFSLSQECDWFVDFERVQKSMPLYEKHQEIIENLTKKYNDSLLALIEPYRNRSSAVDINYIDEKFNITQDSIFELHDRLNKFRTEALNVIDDYRRQSEHALSRRLNYYMNEFCEQSKGQINRSNSESIGQTGIDYTEKLIEFIKQQ